MLYQDGVETSTPTKLYKKELFEGLRYPVGKLYEDIPVAYEVLKRAARVAWIGNVDYYYFQRAASIQNAAFDPKKLDGVEHCHAMMEMSGGITLRWNRRRSAATSVRSATSCSRSGTRPTSRSVNCSGRKWSAAAARWCGTPMPEKSAAGGAAFLWRLSAAALCV